MAATLRVAVIGAFGRMGSMVSQAIEDDGQLALVARVGRHDELRAAAAADVLVDFTERASSLQIVRWAADQGKHVVVGTSGLTEADLAQVRGWLGADPAVGVLVVPNFGVAAMLARRFAVEAAPYFDSVEVIELAHAAKADAPSGTAVEVAREVSAARAGAAPSPDATTSALPGARGARVDEIPVHSVRLPGLVSHQEVLLGRAGETLSLRFDTIDRAAYLPGVLRAVRAAPCHRGVLLGLEAVYGLSAS